MCALVTGVQTCALPISGRGQKPGRVFIQTRSPATPVIKALVHNDSEGFYSAETESRRRAHAPPFGRFAAIVVSSEKPEDAQETARLIGKAAPKMEGMRSEEHTSELQSLMRISYAVFCLKKQITQASDTT